MNPIAQTFTVVEPQNGVEAVFLTGVDLFFQSVDTNFGVTLQIRDTVNGVPTVNTIPYASKTLSASQITSSTDASAPTNFTFDTPVIIQTNQQYALVVIPVGGNPNYNIWTGELGGTDVTTGNPIFNNNQLGTLFASSNDLNFTAIPLESMKYNLYTATFTATSGTGYYRNSNTDFFTVSNIIGNFIIGEQIFMSNSVPAIGYANLQSGYANSFSAGEVVYQGSSLALSTANATVYFGNTSVIKFSNLKGSFAVGTTITSANTGYTSNVVALSQNTVTYSNTSIKVPDASYTDYNVGNYVFVTTSSLTNAQIVSITAANTTTNILTVTPTITFTDPNATIGRVRGDSNLYGYLSSTSRSSPSAVFVVDGVTSTSTLNFANSANQYMIGRTSSAISNITNIFNPKYDSITPQFAQINANETTTSWSFRGTSNTGTLDNNYYAINEDIPYEFIDEQRIIMSRSLELSNTSINGNSTLQVEVSMGTSNTMISPYIDRIRNVVTTTHNKISPASWLNGYTVSYTNANNSFNLGDLVWQSNSTVNTSAIIIGGNSSVLLLTNTTSSNTASIGAFNANSTSIITDANTGAVANVVSTQLRNESINAGFVLTRYISKNVILATGQDSEDIITYLGAYRPPGTNLLVYAKVLHSQDSDTFNNKDWSFMPETSSPALQSSLVNTNDILELTYGLPSSNLIYSGGITSNTTNSIINFTGGNTTAGFIPGMFVYLADQSFSIANASINVAGSGYNNGDIVQLTGTAGYLNSNATFTVTTSSSGNVVSLTVSSGGIYVSNSVFSAQTTANNTGSGTGLTINLTGTNYNQSQKFNVRQVIAVPNTQSLVLSSNTSILSGNVSIGSISNLQSQSSAFKYTANNGIIRYVTSSDAVFDTYLTFAIKIVLISNTTNIVPRIDDMRTLALQV
jgi:hypothetical protein